MVHTFISKSGRLGWLGGLLGVVLERLAPEDLHDLPHVLGLLVIQPDIHQRSEQVLAGLVILRGDLGYLRLTILLIMSLH